jgi:FkbM family methyltransferase
MHRLKVDVMGSTLVVRPRSYDLYVLNEIFEREVYAPRLRLHTEPRVVLDLGANIGAFSLWAARKWNPHTIVAVEMEARNFAALEENVRLNGLGAMVRPVNAAVWDAGGVVKIRRDRLNSGKHAVDPDRGDAEICTVTLPHLLDMAKVGHVDFCKMDIEGSEDRLFNETNEDFFARRVGYLTVEVHPNKGVSVSRVAAYLEALGYEVAVRDQWLNRALMLEATNGRLTG